MYLFNFSFSWQMSKHKKKFLTNVLSNHCFWNQESILKLNDVLMCFTTFENSFKLGCESFVHKLVVVVVFGFDAVIYISRNYDVSYILSLQLSECLCLYRPVPGSLSSLLHLRNRQRQPLPASMPGTLPDPTMPGSSAVLMPVSTTTESTKHIHLCMHWHMQR